MKKDLIRITQRAKIKSRSRTLYCNMWKLLQVLKHSFTFGSFSPYPWGPGSTKGKNEKFPFSPFLPQKEGNQKWTNKLVFAVVPAVLAEET